MDAKLINLDLVGNTNRQIKRNRVVQLITISVFTLSLILSCKLLMSPSGNGRKSLAFRRRL